MSDTDNLFYQLIRVAIGTQDALSRTPSAEEWMMLYDMAKKQSLIGICYASVQRLTAHHPSSITNLSELLRLKWMGMVAKIQQRNEVVNRHCVELQERLAADGFRSCILKGQGVAQLYRTSYENEDENEDENENEEENDDENGNENEKHSDLSLLRQSGDIDVWVEGGMKKALEYLNGSFGECEFDYINAHVHVFPDTEVEVHWRAQAMTNLFLNRKLQEWLCEHQEEMFNANVNLNANGSITTPSAEFNAFYILLHCYHHMFESGLGLRQLMDWYFVLKSRNNANPNANVNIVELYERFGMKKFAEGVLWLIWHVFEGECPDSFLVTTNSSFLTPNPKEGRFLLNEVMQNGNFGHHDERVKKVGSGKMQFLFGNVQHNLHLATHYPSEFFWAPIWLVYHYFWKRSQR